MSKLLSPQPALFSVLVLLLSLCLSAENSDIRCIEAERQALLGIKHDLHQQQADQYLSSWGSEEEKRECCEWIGVGCSNTTGHVILLDLSPVTLGIKNSYARNLAGNISSYVLGLPHLNYLDLSFIDFSYNHIPGFLGSLSKLRYLNLSSTLVTGEVPRQLGNLSSLEVLDLREDDSYSFFSKNIEWVSRLSSLRHLDLSFVNLSNVNDWMQIVNKLPYLIHLELSYCNLPPLTSSSFTSLVNTSTSLTILDLSLNSISASVYPWLFNFSHTLVHLDLWHNLLEGPIPETFSKFIVLEYLDLGYNVLEGSVPEFFGNFTALEELCLYSNRLEGELPSSVWKLPALKTLDAGFNNLSGEFPKLITDYSMSIVELDLSRNKFTGILPENIGQLANLAGLSISGNDLEGVISEAHFVNLSKLRILDFSDNRFIFKIRSGWVPPFQLNYIFLRSCKLGPRFPQWLQTQNRYYKIDISNSGISDSIPGWFWESSNQVYHFNLSNNQINGTTEIATSLVNVPRIDLSSNLFRGPIPSFLLDVAGALYLSRNLFTNLNSLCGISSSNVTFLDISFNNLTGPLPDCWTCFKGLIILRLEHNNLAGEIPFSIGSLTEIESLHLGANNLTGELPSSLRHCQALQVFDVQQNNLLGPIPTWIGKLQNLVILSVWSNHFNGRIPPEICNLTSLHLLHLSSNDISGSIPSCLVNFTAMKQSENDEEKIEHLYIAGSPASFRWGASYIDNLQLLWKGNLYAYESILNLVKSIDLSSNKLTGEIPEEITELNGLVSLNLSRNSLTGPIPPNIGQLKSLDALDLSNNKLSGRIPSSLSQVERLGMLDLSNNNLSGPIPSGTQLQHRNISSYDGNDGLCGDPLPKKCSRDQDPTGNDPETTDQESHQNQQDGFITQGFYISLGLGVVVGFWGICGTLIFNKSWRYGYFKLMDDVGDRVYVMAALFKAKVLRLIRS